MKFGFYAPNFDEFGDARLLADLAREAEDAGWDGFFIWDHLQLKEPLADAWLALAAMALKTQRIRLGTLVTPVPRRHIAKLARELITLDHLSNGRITLGAGAGFPYLPDYAAFGDERDLKTRAGKLDEGLGVLARLQSGEPVQHDGAHYQINCTAFQRPVQSPRVPVWIAASPGATKPLQRAAKWDGVAPVGGPTGLEVAPKELRSVVSFIAKERGGLENFDVSRFGVTQNPGDNAVVSACAEAGATWWLEYRYAAPGALETARARVRQGPPRL